MYKGSYDEQDLVKAGSIVFAADDDLTVEKKTANIPALFEELSENYLLAIEKPQEDTAGDLAVYVYNVIAIDGDNERDVLHVTSTVEKITGKDTYRDIPIYGLFRGQGKIKIGMKFAADSGAITVKYRLFRIK